MKPFASLVLLFSSLTIFSQNLDLEVFVTGLDRPVNLKHAGDDRLFIAEQDGLIKIINADGTVNSTPFLDIENRVGSIGNEQGLLGLAFHPDYATNGYFFVNYTNNSGDTVISRFSRDSANSSLADPNSELIILPFSQPFSNHNGGDMHFGPDGYLYISTGDGGSGGDPSNYAQNLSSLLGSLLRIDVNNSTIGNLYDIPADNPFIGATAGGRDEIWAYGLRNPWKFSFDSSNGDLWIADVGQSSREEINLTTAAENIGGLNYGWRCYEGSIAYNTSGCPSSSTLVFPVSEYAHTGGRCSITGGHRYRGSDYPAMQGWYFFADICTQEVGYLEFSGGTWNSTFENFPGSIVAFGEDINNELYACSLGGTIYKIIDSDQLSIDEFNQDSAVLIYPNPAKNELTLDFASNPTVDYKSILVRDIKGKLIDHIEISSENIQKINTSNYAKGLYLLTLNTTNGKQQTLKFVIR